jgi:hypothetical protein
MRLAHVLGVVFVAALLARCLGCQLEEVNIQMISHAVDHTGYSSSSDLQYKLFDGDVAIDPVPQQQSVREPSSIDGRRELIMRVFGEADGHFISSYVKCLVEFGLTHEDFIAGEVTAVFEKRNGELSTHEAKALGGLFMQLQRKGVIEKTGGTG